MSDVRLYIVTNNPLRALGDMLACATTNAPKWVRVVSDPLDIMELPNGAKCQGLWYGPGTSVEESMWIERRARGGIFFLSDDDRDRIDAWVERHKAAIDAALAVQRAFDAEGYPIDRQGNRIGERRQRSVETPPPPSPAPDRPTLTQQWT